MKGLMLLALVAVAILAAYAGAGADGFAGDRLHECQDTPSHCGDLRDTYRAIFE